MTEPTGRPATWACPLEELPGPRRRARRVAVVGAGVVGLATAWFLQQRGVEVAVFERGRVGSGSSWGNAGWLAPARTTGLTAALAGTGAFRRSGRASLLGSTRGHRARRWPRAPQASLDLHDRAVDAFDELTRGITASVHHADPFLLCFRDETERHRFVAELEALENAGQKIEFDVLAGSAARRLEPALTDQAGAALRLHGQRFLEPAEYMAALAGAVRARGAIVHEACEVRGLRDLGGEVALELVGCERRFDAVVVATGASLGRLACRYGVRVPVVAGRGYSFSVPTRQMPAGPIFLPAQGVACTPWGDRLRIAGTTAFRRADDPGDRRSLQALADAVRPFLGGLSLRKRHDDWVGAHPCPVDGLPLVGRTTSPRVLVAGGHAAGGMVFGPLSGQLLAESLVSGRTHPQLAPFDPLRHAGPRWMPR